MMVKCVSMLEWVCGMMLSVVLVICVLVGSVLLLIVM